MKKAKIKEVKLNVKKLSFIELHELYIFVSRVNDTTFGTKWEASKGTVRLRLKEIEEELHRRAFGFVLEKPKTISVEGKDPLKLDLSKFDEKQGTC